MITHYIKAGQDFIALDELNRAIGVLKPLNSFRCEILEKKRRIRTYRKMSGNHVKLAEQNGINYITFYQRIAGGWDEVRAATQPTRSYRMTKKTKKG